MSLPKKRYRILDNELEEFIVNLDAKEQSDWLFLYSHLRYPGRWYVDALSQGFFLDFEELIGKYRTVSPASLDEFLSLAEELDYQVCFVNDPVEILSAWDHLNDPPGFKLNSEMDLVLEEQGDHAAAEIVRKTGMLPFQLQGFNYLRRSDIKGGLALWSTGTGKTALEVALIKQHIEVEKAYDLTLVVVKSNNKIDTQRKLAELGDIESFIIDGPPTRRAFDYEAFNHILNDGIPLVGIVNYEKFRDDYDYILDLVDNRRVLFFFDEMPSKLRNRSTQLYQSVNEILYTCAPRVIWDDRRPSDMRVYQLTATPIENSPLDQLNCIRLQDPDIFPTIRGWEKKFVASRDPFSHEPATFKNLEEMGLMIDKMTHQVDKDDPDIAKMFPATKEVIRYIDWHPKDRAIYDKFQAIAVDLIKQAKKDPEVKTLNALQLMGVFQMICDAPSMVQKSAENRKEFEAVLASMTEEEQEVIGPKIISGSEAALLLLDSLNHDISDQYSQKVEALREIIVEKHPNEKIVVFSALAGFIQPILEARFEEWGVSYVTFKGTDKQRQIAKDKFRSDSSIRIFLSSDAGSDGIDLPEASVAVDFDLPLKWAVLTQRRNRIHRVTSTHSSVTFYTLLMPNSIEDRKMEIIAKKRGYHQQIFKGQLSEESISARMSQSDLMYILTGEHLEAILGE